MNPLLTFQPLHLAFYIFCPPPTFKFQGGRLSPLPWSRFLASCHKYTVVFGNFGFCQGCVRGQHGRGQGQGQGQGLRGQGQGQGQRSSRPRPRPGVFEAKAKAKATKFCPRGRGQSSRTPIPGLFWRATLRRERLCQVVCLSITLKFNALLLPLVRLCVKYYCIYGIESFTY